MSDALDARLEAGIAVLAVLVFIGILVAAASMGASGFGATSAYAVVAAIVVFILLMAGVGYWLSGKQE
jgi:hypothetical protein